MLRGWRYSVPGANPRPCEAQHRRGNQHRDRSHQCVWQHRGHRGRKGKLIAVLPPHGTAILNADDPNVLAMRSRCAGRVITYGLAPEAMVRAENVNAAWPERLSFTVCFDGQSHPFQTQLPGAHLVHCALAAVAVGLAMGLPLTVAAQAIKRVPPFPCRMSPVIRDDGVTFIRDDAKAPLWSIPAVLDFMKAARAGRKIVVIGTISDYTGNSDRAYVSVARQALAAADQVVFVGSRASKSLKARRDPQDNALQAFPSVEAAGAQLRNFFRPGDLVLLKGIQRDHLEELITTRGTGESQGGAPLAEPSIHAVVGLGNPGAQYQGTPHNVGQTALDFLARSLRAEWVREEQAMFARIELPTRIVYLIKPLTYVNVTGPMLSQLARRLNFAVDQCVLVHDDMDLPLGALRVRMKGSDGGHRGVASIQRAFGRDTFRRVKIGVGRPEQKGRAADHVLTTFAPTQMPVIERACAEAAERILRLLEIPAPVAHPSGQKSARDSTATVGTPYEEAPDPELPDARRQRKGRTDVRSEGRTTTRREACAHRSVRRTRCGPVRCRNDGTPGLRRGALRRRRLFRAHVVRVSRLRLGSTAAIYVDPVCSI